MRHVAATLSLAAAALAACAGPKAPARPDDSCTEACVQRIPRCARVDCARGCGLALDRLVEHEGETVLACVEKSQSACDDWLWASCAASVGAHRDGGPPAPAPGSRR